MQLDPEAYCPEAQLIMQALAATVTEGSPDPQAAVASAFTRRYAASGGTEIFISFETPEPHQLICGFLRLSALCLRTIAGVRTYDEWVPHAGWPAGIQSAACGAVPLPTLHSLRPLPLQTHSLHPQASVHA